MRIMLRISGLDRKRTMAKEAKLASFEWLDRRVAAPGPYMTLVRSEADFLAALKHLGAVPRGAWVGELPMRATCHYLTGKDDERCCIVAVNFAEDNTGIEIAGLLVHEAVHIVQEYFEGIGERNPAREQQAYAVQMVSQELMWEYRRQTQG